MDVSHSWAMLHNMHIGANNLNNLLIIQPIIVLWFKI